jgi:hypothetical protein
MVWQLPGNERADVRGLPTGLIDLSEDTFKLCFFIFLRSVTRMRDT